VRAITTRNAVPLRHESFDDDAEKIVATVLGGLDMARRWDDRGRISVKIGYAVAGSLAGLALLTIAALVHLWLVGRPLSASIGEWPTTFMLVACSALGAGFGFAYEARRRRRRVRT